jgi:hypothetical protein
MLLHGKRIGTIQLTEEKTTLLQKSKEYTIPLFFLCKSAHVAPFSSLSPDKSLPLDPLFLSCFMFGPTTENFLVVCLCDGKGNNIGAVLCIDLECAWLERRTTRGQQQTCPNRT